MTITKTVKDLFKIDFPENQLYLINGTILNEFYILESSNETEETETEYLEYRNKHLL